MSQMPVHRSRLEIFRVLGSCVLCLVWSVTLARAQQLLANPSFEDPAIVAAGQNPVEVGQRKRLVTNQASAEYPAGISGITAWQSSLVDVGLGQGVRDSGLSREPDAGEVSQHAFVRTGGTRLSQVSIATVQPTESYQARIRVAIPVAATAGRFQLWAGVPLASNPDDFEPGAILLKEISFGTSDWTQFTPDLVLPTQTWANLELNYTPPADGAMINKPLTVSLVTSPGSSQGVNAGTLWDQASLARVGPPTVIFVNGPLTTGASNGSSWSNAFRGATALQDALDAAMPITAAGGAVQVWVAQGTYKPSRTPPGEEQEPRSRAFLLHNRVEVIGGFAGIEVSAAQADLALHPTTLTGNFDDPEISDVFYVVRSLPGTDDTAVLDRIELTIRDVRFGSLRGLIHVSSSSPTLRLCSVRGSSNSSSAVDVEGGSPFFDRVFFRFHAWGSAGGGIYIFQGNPRVDQCTFSDCQTGYSGGACFLVEGAFATFRRCFFDRCGADGSGAVSGPADFYDCRFYGNDALHTSCLTRSRFIVRCAFYRNGDLYLGSPFGCVSGGTAVMGCTFVKNRTSAGPILSGCTLACNSIFYDNKGLSGIVSAVTATNCLVVDNRLPSDWGAVQVGTGGAHNMTITGNRFVGSDNPPTTEMIQVGGDIAGLTRSIVQGWTGTLGGIANRATPSTTSIFVDPDGPDNIPGNEDDDYRLLPGFPGIDAGDSTRVPPDVADLDGDGDTTEPTPVDILGGPRFLDDPIVLNTGVPLPSTTQVVDIGPFEMISTGLRRSSGNGTLQDLQAWIGGALSSSSAVYFDHPPDVLGGPISIGNAIQTGPARFVRGTWSFEGTSPASRWTVNGPEGVVIGPTVAIPSRVEFAVGALQAQQIVIDAGGYLLAGSPNGSLSTSLDGAVKNLGTLELPGSATSFGSLVINGSYDQDITQGGRRQGGVLNVSVGMRNEAFSGDLIAINGAAKLSGSLELSVFNDASSRSLQLGDSWDVMTATGGITLGDDGRGFQVIRVPVLDNGLFLVPQYVEDAGQIVALRVTVGNLNTILGFGGSGSQSVTALNPKAVAVGDFDGRDGDDVAILVPTPSDTVPSLVFVFYAKHRVATDWDGFIPPTDQISIIPVGIRAVAMDRGNLDGLDFDDLVVANAGSNNLTVLLSRPATVGGLFVQSSSSPISLSASPTTVSVADFVHMAGEPSIEDVVVGLHSGGAAPPRLLLLRNNNQPSVGLSPFPAAIDLEDEPTTTSPTDNDGDKPIDVAVAFASRNVVQVYRNQTEFSQTSPFFRNFPDIQVGSPPVQLVGTTRRTPDGSPWRGRDVLGLDSFLDLNHDGKADLISVDSGSNRLSLILNTSGTGTGQYAPTLAVSVVPPGAEGQLKPLFLTACDFDQDHDADLAVVAGDTPETAKVYQIRNDLHYQDINGQLTGILTLASAIEIPPNAPGEVPILVSSGDVDDDDRNDVVIVASLGGGIQGSTSVIARRNATTSTRCRADLDNDGNFANGGSPDEAVNIDDLLFFLTAFELGADAVDLDDDVGSGLPDRAVTISDLLFFLGKFEEGC